MSDVVDAFDGAAHVYDDWYRTEKGGQVFRAERRIVDSLLPEFGVGVEIGAGTGVFSDALTEGGRLIVCLDLSREMLSRARRRGLPCVLGSADSMPFRRGSLGFAYMITVIEFLVTPNQALEEASRVTGKDAPIVVLFINRESPWGELYRAMAEKGDPIFSHAHLYSPEEVDEIGSHVGLRPAGMWGTLTKGPTSPDAGDEIVEPSAKTGVIAVKLVKQGAE
ncbi:MAG: class I SAM-dependent methyltransferase [Candidatus Bathyarchaeota archaeon]|nr:class I SAM-dependent methyltransferase [Candidatus Bathyarchaeota archaeon]